MTESSGEKSIIARAEYYTQLAEKFFSEYPRTFESFVEDKTVIERGDTLLTNRMATAYNFASISQFPIVGPDPLIFYNNYIQRTKHFGELLARMEHEKIIEEDNVTLGVKATKVLGVWNDEEAFAKDIFFVDGEAAKTSESVEGIVIFHPRSAKQAIDIGRFLLSRAKKGAVPKEIQGSWDVPDSRARNQLRDILENVGFRRATANILGFQSGNLVAIRQKTHFGTEEGWENYPMLVNSELYEYLTKYNVLP